MPKFRYKALTQTGELVNGSLAATNAAEVANRVEYLGLVLIETRNDQASAQFRLLPRISLTKPSSEAVSVFTRDLALLLKAGARINDALDLLATDVDIGRLRPVIVKVRTSVLSGESLSNALAAYPELFPPVYLALVGVGESSGTLDQVLEALAHERVRADMMRRKITDSLAYPAFVLCAAFSALTFFLLFVLPQFSSVLRDLGAKLDPIVAALLNLSDFARSNTSSILVGAALLLMIGWFCLRIPRIRASLIRLVASLPLVRTAWRHHRATLFCRNLSLLLTSGLTTTATLRVLTDMMARTGGAEAWAAAAEQVRRGGKLSDSLANSAVLPPLAIRMLRLGEETGQLPMLANRVADLYEVKLQRTLDRVVAVIGPLSIILISTIVGGLITSIMTALLSVSQSVG